MRLDGKKEVLVSVTDTGSGINSEIFGRLFSKFASKSYQGTGLGLFICKSIIQAHGGRIWAENNNIGGYSRYWGNYYVQSTYCYHDGLR